MLVLKHIKKKFKNQDVLIDVNLSVKGGQIIYIYGSNGCGKSTLFKIITDIYSKDSGELIKDSNVNIGALIENPGFIENKSILYNLQFLYNLKNTFNYQKVNKLCNLFDLNLDSKIKMKNYSVGMKQKVGIIQALMEDQNLILLDEPTRGLDDSAIETLKGLILEAKSNGKAVIIASHDKIDGIKYDEIYHLNKGILQKQY